MEIHSMLLGVSIFLGGFSFGIYLGGKIGEMEERLAGKEKLERELEKEKERKG